jgi:hypothetical protein
MLIKVKGKIQFEPEDKTRKHKSQASWKRIAMILTNDDLADYYSWFIKRRFNLELNKPLRGSHVSFINDSERDFKEGAHLWNEGKKLFDGAEIDFYIDPEPRTNGEHWWLRVYCPDSEMIRASMGLSPVPYFTLHLTLGYANSRWIDHSNYILEICKRHEIISSEPRKPMSEHEIFEFENC